MVDKIVCTNKFKKSFKKLIKRNKLIANDLRETIAHLSDENYITKNDLKRHKLNGGRLKGYNDIHFSKRNNDLILIYKFQSDGTLFILELQNVTNHKYLDKEIITKNVVDYDENEIFEESMSYEQINLINLYNNLKIKCNNLESTDYEDGYYDAMYDMIKIFELNRYFEQ